jgi:integrase
MRLGEILSLGIVRCGKNSHWGEAEVQNNCVYLPGKITKTNEGRYVSINQDVREACLRLTKSLGQHFTHRKFYDRWDDARAKIAPGDKDFVFHCLRHTCASRMANELKMNTLIIAKQLGHKSSDTTNRYVHQKPDTLQKFSSAMTLGKSALSGADKA